MDRTQLLQHFDTLAETPAAVAKLRETILQLGLSGMLVAQDPQDTPAERIVGRAKKPQSKPNEETPPGSSEGITDRKKLPAGWALATLSQVASMAVGKTPATKQHDYWEPGSIPWVSIGDMEPWGVVITTGRRVTKLAADEVFRSRPVPAGTLLMSFKLTIGKVAKLGVDAFHNEAIVSVKPVNGVEQLYLFRFLPVLARAGVSKSAIKGATLNKESIAAIQIPLPPTAEQKRIVAKVEGLLALCDELEARQTAAREHRTRLVRSALDQLTFPFRSSRRESAQTETKRGKSLSGLTSAATRMEDGDFRRHAAFVLNAFPNLTAAPEDIPALRQAILALAVQGHLVAQNSKDEPASAILNQCQLAARKLGIKTAEQSPPIGDDESPFELPSGWAWARLRNVGYLSGGGTPSKSKSELWNGALPWVSPKDMKVAYLQDAQDHISRKALDQSAVKLIPPGSLLFVVRGMILIHSFPAAINKVEVTINQDMKALQPFVPECVEFLLLACRGFKQQMLDNVERSTHGTCKLVTEKVTEFVIGLPPLAEQQRIVAKVAELMRWCDALEARLTTAQTTATHLLDITLHQILNPAA